MAGIDGGCTLLLEDANQKELKHEWKDSIEIYSKALSACPVDNHAQIGMLREGRGYAWYRWAFHAKARDEFLLRINQAKGEYEAAREAYGKAPTRLSTCRQRRCDGMLSLLEYWSTESADRRMTLAKAAWSNAAEALDELEMQNTREEFGSTFNQLSLAGVISYNYDDTVSAREERLRQLLSYSEKTIKFLSGTNSIHELARAYAKAGAVTSAIQKDFVDSSHKDEFDLRAWSYWLKARALSEEEAFFEIPFQTMLQGWPSACKTDERRKIIDKMKALAEKTDDNWLMAWNLNNLAHRNMMELRSEEDASGRVRLAKGALESAERSKKYFAIMGFTSTDISQIWVQVPEAGFYINLSDDEKDSEKKRDLIEKAYEYNVEQTKVAVESKYPDVEAAARFMFGFLLSEMGKDEPSIERKRMYLARAVEHLKQAATSDISLHPNLYYLHGVDLFCLADAEFELAGVMEKGPEMIAVLRGAVVRRKEALTLSEKDLLMVQDTNPNVWADLGDGRHKMGEWGIRLHELSKDPNDLAYTTEAYDKAAEWYEKASNPSRSAENNWRAAQSYDMMGEFQKASERFVGASEGYRTAGRSYPDLKQLYEDYAVYLQAWGEIERARYYHSRQDSALAGKCYEKAASIHASTTRWNYLATNYAAWAILEKAEDLSRAEKCEESIRAFEDASSKFAVSKKALSQRLPTIEDQEEVLMVRKLERGADVRRGYCAARTCLEEARILQRRGDPFGSSERYKVAVERFQDLSKELESDLDKNECQFTIALAKAWNVMAKAEAEESSQLYQEASGLFNEAKDLSQGDRGKLLAEGHSRFCRALELATSFSDTGDLALSPSVNQNLDGAANYYTKAGVAAAAEFAKASKYLFEGYVQIATANRESNQKKKARLYAMAEELLRTSVLGLEKAGYHGKVQQVNDLLHRVKEERELAVSLNQVLTAPEVVSSTIALPAVVPTIEKATGVERFDHADIQGRISADKNDLKIGEEIEVGIELVNTGRSPAQLIKLQNPFPSEFILKEASQGYRMENGYLDLMGKGLAPLKTENIKLILKPSTLGMFALKPHILYLDENGKYRSHEPESMKITVEEGASLAGGAFSADTTEAAEARSLLAGLGVVTLSHYRIVGNYVRFAEPVRNTLKDARQKIISACSLSSQKRENYIIWAPPGSGKTYFVEEVAAQLGDSTSYHEFNLAKLNEAGFCSGLDALRECQKPCLCLVDEVDAKPDESWPYEMLMPFLDASVTEGRRYVFVLAGSTGSSLDEMKKTIAARKKGPDVLSRVPTENEYSIPSMGIGDRLLVVLSQFRQAGKQMGRDVREVEKLGLYYVALSPRLSNARQLREFAVRCAERVPPGDDRLKYDSLFNPGDLENKLFWTQAHNSARALMNSFLLIED
jgi:hypothetical protein